MQSRKPCHHAFDLNPQQQIEAAKAINSPGSPRSAFGVVPQDTKFLFPNKLPSPGSFHFETEFAGAPIFTLQIHPW